MGHGKGEPPDQPHSSLMSYADAQVQERELKEKKARRGGKTGTTKVGGKRWDEGSEGHYLIRGAGPLLKNKEKRIYYSLDKENSGLSWAQRTPVTVSLKEKRIMIQGGGGGGSLLNVRIGGER